MGKSLQHAAMALPRGYLFGLTLSTAGASTTFTTAAGEAVDDTFVDLMTLGSSLAKTTGAWAVGAATGSLDTGAIANSTWYHVYLIKRVDTGVVDVLTSLSATSPTMPTNYTIKRRIGSMLTNGSAQWVQFRQLDDEFLWDAPVGDVNVSNLGTSAVTYTLTTPLGIQVLAKLRGYINNATACNVLLSSLDVADVVPQSVLGNNTIFQTGNGVTMPFGEIQIRTNTSRSIRARSNAASSSLIIATYGWIDTRGKLS
jgi:hypothetical protein